MTARGARAIVLAALLLPPCGVARAQRADAVVLRRPSFVTLVPIASLQNQTTAAATVRPDVEPGRVAGELLVGSYGGIGGFFLGHYLARTIAERVGDPSDQTSDNIAFASGVVGAWVGTTVGVYAIGNIGNQTGSLSTTAFGAGLGAVAGAFLDRLVFAPRSGDPSAGASAIRWGETIVESFLPSIGATIAFNSSRRFK